MVYDMLAFLAEIPGGMNYAAAAVVVSAGKENCSEWASGTGDRHWQWLSFSGLIISDCSALDTRGEGSLFLAALL